MGRDARVPDSHSPHANRLILPLVGLLVALTAYALQTVWGLIDIDALVAFIRSLTVAGLMLCVGVLGLVEATVIACLYLPGTAILIVLFLGLQPTGTTALAVLAALNVGTALGYGASWLVGRAVRSHLFRLMGETYVAKVKAAIERYGLASLLVLAAHPNNLAVAFAVLGVTSAGTALRYFLVSIAVQNIWWLGFWSVAELFFRQQVVTRSNFYLYLAALFAAWLAYELVSRSRARRRE
jgi:hypothetical protein